MMMMMIVKTIIKTGVKTEDENSNTLKKRVNRYEVHIQDKKPLDYHIRAPNCYLFHVPANYNR